MVIEKANNTDHQILTQITKKSKAFWGYSVKQIEIWSAFLTVTSGYIEANSVYKLSVGNQIVGYYSFFNQDEKTIKLDNLFVLPEYIGKGLGRLLMEHFLLNIDKTDTKTITLNSEPNAEPFYSKLGFIKVGEIETSIKDRYMPIMELTI
jgi:predicted GNAT family acetyltransferase